MPNPTPDWDQFGFPSPPRDLIDARESLEAADCQADLEGRWSPALWQLLRSLGAHRWSVPTRYGGDGLPPIELVVRDAKLAEASLTGAFILSQHDAAIRRLAAGEPRAVAVDGLERIAAGEALATVGISHLTTSKRVGARALVARPDGGSFCLAGAMPWVTAAPHAQLIVAGATLDDGRQLLVALAPDQFQVDKPFDLAALQASETAEVHCDETRVDPSAVLAGPAPDINKIPGLAGTGGLETSTLALGLARAACVVLESLAADDPTLEPTHDQLISRWSECAQLLKLAVDGGNTAAEVRARANTLVLAATQALLAASKGSGFLRTSVAQRWARQALFFLVWSCPTPVARATMLNLANA